MSFDKGIQLCAYHYIQDKEYFESLRNFSGAPLQSLDLGMVVRVAVSNC